MAIPDISPEFNCIFSYDPDLYDDPITFICYAQAECKNRNEPFRSEMLSRCRSGNTEGWCYTFMCRSEKKQLAERN